MCGWIYKMRVSDSEEEVVTAKPIKRMSPLKDFISKSIKTILLKVVYISTL